MLARRVATVIALLVLLGSGLVWTLTALRLSADSEPKLELVHWDFVEETRAISSTAQYPTGRCRVEGRVRNVGSSEIADVVVIASIYLDLHNEPKLLNEFAGQLDRQRLGAGETTAFGVVGDCGWSQAGIVLGTGMGPSAQFLRGRLLAEVAITDASGRPLQSSRQAY